MQDSFTTTALICGESPHFFNKENHAPYTCFCRKHTEAAQHEADIKAREAAIADGMDAQAAKDVHAPRVADVYDKCWAFSRFPTVHQTPASFVKKRLVGIAWIPASFGGNGRRTNENWQRSELIGLDYDNNVRVAQAVAVPLISEHAMLVHPSSSSSEAVYKSRVVFRLDEPYTDAEEYRLAVKALGRLLGLPEDACSYKPAQLFYGSTNRIEEPHINLEARLPRAIIDAEIAKIRAEQEASRAEAARRRAEQHYQPIAKDSDRAARAISRKLQKAYEKLVTVPSDRTTAAYGTARYLARFVACWPLTEQDIERTVLDALRANGAAQKYGEQECLRHIGNGIKDGLRDQPEPLEMPNAPRRENLRKPETFTPAPAYEAPSPLTGWDMRIIAVAGHWQVCVVDLLARATGTPGDFTPAQLAECAGVEPDTARNWLTAAEGVGAICRLSTEKGQGKSLREEHLPRLFSVDDKNTHYRLTTDAVWRHVREALPSACLILMELAQVRLVDASELESAGFDRAPDLAAHISAINDTEAADEVDTESTKTALRKVDELRALQKNDTAIFAPDTLPTSKGELRKALLNDHLSQFPEGTNHRHSDLMWAAGGVKQGSVSKLVKQSTHVASESPVWTPVRLPEQPTLADVTDACKKERGAPVAWLDVDGKQICVFSSTPPKAARGVLLNCGKTYSRRPEQQPFEFEEPMDTKESPATETKTTEKAEKSEAEAVAATARRLARADLLPVFKGCLKASGWRRFGGAFGYWYRSDVEGVSFENTIDGMKSALLYDFDHQRAGEYRPEAETFDGYTADELAEVAF
jgi:hypothetical protein